MMALETRSCTLKVSSKDQFGFLWLEQGELIAARNAENSGKDAALQILAWKNVFIDIDFAPRRVKREISMPLMMLILESGQIDDEIRSESTNHRQHERYELLLALDFDLIEQMTRHCSLRDISLSGAYIETDHKTSVGESIVLTLSSPILKSNCSIEAIVVRKDKHGIGICFQLKDPHQSQMIQTLINGSMHPVGMQKGVHNQQPRIA